MHQGPEAAAQAWSVPWEFSHGAFRFAHAMVRPKYHLNRYTTDATIREVIDTSSAKEPQNTPLRKEWLVQFCKETLKKEHFDYFVFGHRHLVLDVQVGENSRYINTGDWLDFNSYAVFDGEKMEVKYYGTDTGTKTQEPR